MLIVCEEEEAFFDTEDHLMSEYSIEVKEALEYDIWLREPKSVGERRGIFLSKMGFSDFSTNVESEHTGFNGIAESNDENFLSERRKSNTEANCSVDYCGRDWLDGISIEVERERQYKSKQVEACVVESLTTNKKKKKTLSWLRSFIQKTKKNQLKLSDRSGEVMRIEHNRKKYLECSAVYTGQELKAHDGLIWTMKFSPDGRYLASGGEDGVVCIWRLAMVDSTFNADKRSYGTSTQRYKSNPASIIIPDKIFRLEEVPVKKFIGHSSDVLDLAWSKSNHLLSASMDKTVRLWHVESDECLGVFRHSNYVTSVQFNPVEERIFISGSIDGNVRVWDVHRRRVQEWSNVRDIVTVVCYQPNGEGFVVGTLSGNCRFYESSSGELELNAEINFHGKRRLLSNKITGIQFLNNDSRRLMITSEDSMIRIVDGLEVVCKYKGLRKSGSQMSASLTSRGRHIVSIGEDEHIYFWNYNNPCIQTIPKKAKSMQSCESFFTKGVSVVLPWSSSDNNLACGSSPTSAQTHDGQETTSRMWGAERFPFRSSSMTWPEEKLPLWDSFSLEDEC